MRQVATYSCGSKRCKRGADGSQFRGLTPSAYRAATGGSVTCPRCGEVARLIKVESEVEVGDFVRGTGSARASHPEPVQVVALDVRDCGEDDGRTGLPIAILADDQWAYLSELEYVRAR